MHGAPVGSETEGPRGEAAEAGSARRWVRPAITAALGALAGGLYAHFVGCRTGTCPLTSSIWTASIYGAFVGGAAGWPGRPEGSRRQAPGSGPDAASGQRANDAA
jgi:hypothetical protein